MVEHIIYEQIEQLVNDCITKKGYEAVKAFADLNRYIGKLRKQYQETIKHERT